MVWAYAALFLVIGVVLIGRRQDAAHLQAALAGARVLPGCAIVEGIVFLLLAVGLVVGYLRGAF